MLVEWFICENITPSLELTFVEGLKFLIIVLFVQAVTIIKEKVFVFVNVRIVLLES